MTRTSTAMLSSAEGKGTGGAAALRRAFWRAASTGSAAK